MTDYAKGAASSLNKTVGELANFVSRSSSRSQTTGSGIRGRLNGLIWEIGRKAFEAGYKEAYEQCARYVEENGEFPTTMSFSGHPKLAPSATGLVAVRVSVQKIKVFKLPSFAREISFWDRFRKR